MSINCDYKELVKDKNVREILQKIYDELKVSKADKPHVLTKIASSIGKVELFNQNTQIENDELFIRCLSDNDIITNKKYTVQDPGKNRDEIDYSLLSSPEEFRTPYIAVSFDILDRQFLYNLYQDAIDTLVVNPYPTETQKELVSMAIIRTKALTQTDNIVLSWNEIDKEDRKHIGIWQTLQNLKADKQIEILNFDAKLDTQTNEGNTKFWARIRYTSIVPFTGKDTLIYRGLSLDPKTRNVFYSKIKSKEHTTGFRTENRYYLSLKTCLEKKGKKILYYNEIYRIIYPYSKIPAILKRSEKRRIVWVINYLKLKLNNLKLFTNNQDSYELVP